MNLNFHVHVSEALSPSSTNPPTTLFGKSLHSSHTSFPIIAVAIIGILATGFLLVGYYIFVIKCCLNWHRIDLLRRFSLSRRRNAEDPLTIYTQTAENRGLDEALIRSIPIFQYKKGTEGKNENGEGIFVECAVCLNEFQEDEKLRSIPNCNHIFHIDCIDVWLQNNANCPLCRNSISIDVQFPPQIIQNLYGENNFAGRDQEYVVIEIGDQRNLPDQTEQSITNLSPRKLQKKVKKLNHVSSMGDECIDIRNKNEEFSVQPIRRSFSMDSASDQQLFLAVQAIVQQHQHKQQHEHEHDSEDCSNHRVIKRSFFSFGHGRGSRSSVLPVHMEL